MIQSASMQGGNQYDQQPQAIPPMDPQGVFIAIEGTDGTGKGTQYRLLVNRLRQAGYDVDTVDCPRYEEDSSYFVRQYLNGEYGSAEEVGPYRASYFYALDRYAASFRIRQSLNAGKIVIANRFTGSNLGHQGTKITDGPARKDLYDWIRMLEFDVLDIPQPDLNVIFYLPSTTAQRLIEQKDQRSYINSGNKDLHELDPKHLADAVESFSSLVHIYPNEFMMVDCSNGPDGIRPPEDINDQLWRIIQPFAANTRRLSPIDQARAMSESAPSKKITPETAQATVAPRLKEKLQEEDPQPDADGARLVERVNGAMVSTSEGRDYLKQFVTNTEGNVYAFNQKMSSSVVAAAMARLSRRGDDMRVTVLDEFSGEAGRDKRLLKRVISAYGDDSVQQLTGMHLVVEDASNLLTKKLEWGRLAAYLEQSTRYIYFDQKDVDGHYKYVRPDYFPTKLGRKYTKTMDQIFGLYSDVVHKLTHHIRTNSSTSEDERDGAWKAATRAQACDAARPLLPVGTKSTVGIFASGQALETLIMRLLSDELPEAQATGQSLLDEARKIAPEFLERADKPERGGAWQAYRRNVRDGMRSLADKHDLNMLSNDTDAVKLIDYSPRNEFDLLPHMLFEYSSASISEIEQAIDNMSYAEKSELFDAYIGERLNRRHRPGRALEMAHYSWELICDYGSFRDLQRHRMVNALEWQQLSPRYGYDMPDIVAECGVEDQFERCFDLSLRLYSDLQAAGYSEEAQYATLLGHKMRWKVDYNARAAFHIHELRTTPQGHPGYRALVNQMHEKLSEIHPRLAEAMKFVNSDEDPELTRLAAERYTQMKLNQDKS